MNAALKFFALIMVTVPVCGQQAKMEVRQINTGPFTVHVPAVWTNEMAVEIVPLQPLYSTRTWAEFRADPMNQLKPYYGNRPTHWAVRLPAMMGLIGEPIPAKAEDGPNPPQILFHRADQWGVAFTDGKDETRNKGEVLAELRRSLGEAMGKAVSGSLLHYMDASLSFEAMKKPLKFKGGEGVRLLCQWTIEPTLLCRGELHYLFVGLSDDDKCHVIATFPVTLSGLPDGGSNDEHLGYSSGRYEELSKKFEAYEKRAVRWLEENQFNLNPSLKELDAMMESITARTWTEG